MSRSSQSLEILSNELVMARDMNALVIGSIGRAVAFRECVGDPYFEFTARAEDPLGGPNWPRDVDLIGDPDSIPVGHHDFGMFDEIIVRMKDGSWRVNSVIRSGSKSRTETHQIASWIFEPVEGLTIYDLPCVTVRPATHHLLLEAANQMHYPHVREALFRSLPDQERALLRTSEAQVVRDALFSWEVGFENND